MNTATTIESRIPFDHAMEPLSLEGWSDSDAPHFWKQIVDAWVNITGGSDGVIHQNGHGRLTPLSEEDPHLSSVTALLSTRERHIS